MSSLSLCGCVLCVCVCVVESALSQIMLFVDGMNGVIRHAETLQWLYTLTGSLVRISVGLLTSMMMMMMTTILSLLLLLVEVVVVLVIVVL